MRAFHLSGKASAPALEYADAAAPAPAPSEVQVRVLAAGVIRSELGWYPTTHLQSGEPRRHAIPSHEFSGVVSALGEGVTDFARGDEVFGMNDWFSQGALADYCLTKPACIARKPRALSHIEAASVPISALTAWQGLIDRAKVQAGERVLVHGGAGGVGLFAVQLARICGAHVIATASPANLAFVSELGAELVIDYTSQRFEKAVSNADVVFNTVGAAVREASWLVLGPGGRMVEIASEAESVSDQRTKDAFFIVEPKGVQLARIAELLAAGRLRTYIDAVVPFEKSPDAYFGALPGRSRRGKIVVAVAAEAAPHTTLQGEGN